MDYCLWQGEVLTITSFLKQITFLLVMKRKMTPDITVQFFKVTLGYFKE